MVHFADFSSALPFDHLTRALDELRRGGLELGALAVSMEDGVAAVHIEFDALSLSAIETYLARIARMPGVEDLRSGLTTAR